MKTINIKFRQEFEFEQEIEVTDEQYEILKKYDGNDIPKPKYFSTAEPEHAHSILTSAVDYRSPLDEGEIQNFEIIEVE
jgi:hypothetical protein